jgi:GH18 family chitinase
MITKAGVPSNKIVVGVTSYARSFQMVDPSCSEPDCPFTGPESGATPRSCTQARFKTSRKEIVLTNQHANRWLY